MVDQTSTPGRPSGADRFHSALTRRGYGAAGDQTVIERFEEAFDRVAYVITRPGVVALGWLTGAEPRTFGLAAAQIGGLAVSAVAVETLISVGSSRALPAAAMGLFGFMVATLLVPAFRSMIECGDTPEAIVRRQAQLIVDARSLSCMVAVTSLLTGIGPKPGVPALFLLSIGLHLCFEHQSPASFQRWLRTTIASSGSRDVVEHDDIEGVISLASRAKKTA